MKPTRFLTTALILVGLAVSAFAAGTPAGTTISNQATGTYKDANGNALTGVSSNTVTTTVSQVAGTSLGGDQALSMASMTSVTYPVTLTNTGNGTDSFTISSGLGGGEQPNTYTVEVYHDVDGSGTVNVGDTLATLAEDILADGTYAILVQVSDTTFVGAPNADEIAVTVTSLSNVDGGVSDATVLTTTVQAAALTATISSVDDGDPQPGDVITYEICLSNTGGTTAYNVQFVNPIPANTTYSTGTIRHGDGSGDWGSGAEITDADDSGVDTYDGNYDITTTNTITVDVGDIAGGGSVCIYYRVTINSGLAEGETVVNEPVIDYENVGGDPYPTVDPTDGGGETVVISQSFGVDFAATGTISFTGDPSDSLFYAFTVQNLGNGIDNFNLTSESDYVVWTFYADGGDGVLSEAELLAGSITTTGNLGQLAVGTFVAVGVIPAGTADEAADATTFTAASQGDAGASTDTGTASTTTTAPIIISGAGGLFKSVSPTGAQEPGTVLTYTLSVLNSGTGAATNVVITDHIPLNTTYESGTLILNGSTLGDISDDDDGDGGTATTTGGDNGKGVVTFTIDNLPAAGTVTMSFQVSID